tara:strand:+ start:523 stop:648 length:126 start_codon:yes stop_codon:yes gene_type:complete
MGDNDSITSGSSGTVFLEEEKLIPKEIVRNSRIASRSNINL